MSTSVKSKISRARRVACLTCPFNDGLNAEATVAQNYGCLPTKWDILEAKDKCDEDWMCHDDETLICGGLAAERQLGSGKQVRYSEWYHTPPAAAVCNTPPLSVIDT